MMQKYEAEIDRYELVWAADAIREVEDKWRPDGLLRLLDGVVSKRGTRFRVTLEEIS